MIIRRVGRRGRVTVPQPVRDWLGIEEGDPIVFARHGDAVVLQAMTKTLLDLRGMGAVDGPQDLEAIRRQVREHRAGRRGRPG